jgi:hypothetical protein
MFTMVGGLAAFAVFLHRGLALVGVMQPKLI